jgi:hypothetical protein
MVQPKKYRRYDCPLKHMDMRAGMIRDEIPAIQGRYCLNSCSEYKHNKCPRFKWKASKK